MRRWLLAGAMALILAACGSGGQSSPRASAPMPCASAGSPAPNCAPPDASTAPPPGASATPATGTPVGTWSLTLVGGPTPGTYGGTDEMICTGIANGPMSVSFQPASSAPIQQIDATSGGSAEGSILVSAGGIESAAIYQATAGQPFQTFVLGDATITDGVLTLSVSGTQQFPGEPIPREIELSATCSLFPSE